MTHTWQQLAYIHGLGAELPSHVFNPDKQVYHLRKPVKLVLSPENSTLPYLNKSTPHFIHEIETIDYKVIGVNVFLSRKRFNFIPLYYYVPALYRFQLIHLSACFLKVVILHIKFFTYYIYILVRTRVILKFP